MKRYECYCPHCCKWFSIPPRHGQLAIEIKLVPDDKQVLDAINYALDEMDREQVESTALWMNGTRILVHPGENPQYVLKEWKKKHKS